MIPCSQTMESLAIPNHTHVCDGTHDIVDDSHYCPDCKRWWWER